MMNIHLDPGVSDKLRQFARRRIGLIVARGMFAGLVTFLMCLALGGFIDWYWLLTDSWRWAVAGLVYLPALLVVWITTVRHLLSSPASRDIAVRVEQLQPKLREQLLSAVELSEDDPTAIHDSPVFRTLLQQQVARQMGQVPISGLLPVRLLLRWSLAALLVTAAAAWLLSSPDIRFRQLAVRAMLPGANLQRVSRIQIDVLQPSPPSLILAEDETIAVVVEVSGGAVNDVILETETQKQGVVRQSMRARSTQQFVANIHVADESVDYRIHAGDAITQRFRIDSRPRPRVLEFTKTFQFPDYSLLPDTSQTETHGDLIALQDTQARLTLRLDQPVSVAELQIEGLNADTIQTVSLTPGMPGTPGTLSSDSASDAAESDELLWTATVPIAQAAIYRVRLVGRETGFENIFSPKYEIRPQPDQIPRTGFLNQPEPALLLPPHDLLELQAMAEDDLPLVSLQQHVSVNGDEWLVLPVTMLPVAGSHDLQVTAAWQWDLMAHKLRTGDQVVTKLVATDRKGQSGESIPLRIVVADSQFEPERHTQMERRLSLIEHLIKFAADVNEHKVAALEVIQRLQATLPDAASTEADQAVLRDMAARQQGQAEQLLAVIQDLEQDMSPGADSYELDLAGRVITRILCEYAVVPRAGLSAMQHTTDVKVLHNDLDEIKRAFERVEDDARHVAEQYQHAAVHSFLQALAIDLNALLKHQQLIVESPTQTWQRLLRQETVVVHQLRTLEQLIQQHQSSLPAHMEGHIRNLTTWIESQRDRLQFAMESEDQLPKLQTAGREFLQQLEQRQRIDAVDGGLPGRLINAWRDLDHRSGTLSLPVEQLAQTIQQEDRISSQALQAIDSTAGQTLRDQASRFAAHIDLKFRRSLDQFRIRKQLTQLRTDADSDTVADAGLTQRAVVSLLNQHRTVSPDESKVADSLLQIAPAYRTLEAGHQLMAAQSALHRLLEQERWNSQQLLSLVDHPRQWDLLQRLLELSSQRLREARVEPSLVGRIDELRWSAASRDAQRKITERRWKREAVVSAGHELAGLREQLDSVVHDLQPTMTAAREIIAQYAPTISQMAEQAALQVRQLEEQTIRAADELEADPPAQPEASPAESAATTVPQLTELQQQQRSINHQIDDLLEALVEDANRQDLLDAQQRERARDADDSIAAVQKPAEQMNRHLQQALQKQPDDQQLEQLALAAEQQEKTAGALDLVAQHFQRLDDNLDVIESRTALRQAEQDLGIAALMEQRYEESARLEDRLQESPQQMLQELEALLQQNPAMQQALSEISQDALQEARNALQFAANDEQNLQRANERSDAKFQERKRELAEDVRQMGAEASRLSSMLVANAHQSAGQGKATDAQQKFADTQQKLNEAASKAGSARDDVLLADLAQTATDVHSALVEATDLVKQAGDLTATIKDQTFHPDEKARQAQQKDSERRRQQFRDQLKRTANDQVKRADDAKRRSEQQLRTAENELQNAGKKVDQAKKQLERKPEDNGLRRNLTQEESRQQTARHKVEDARQRLQKAELSARNAQERAQQIANQPQPPLTAANPAVQLAEQYAIESLHDAEALSQQARQLVKALDFGSDLLPTQNQLTSAEQQQTEVASDVRHAAEDIARAARHERRLNNLAVVEPLQSAAGRIEQVARDESTHATQQLKIAAATASQISAAQESSATTDNDESRSAEESQPSEQTLREQSQQAQNDLAVSEDAIAEQADRLGQILDPLLAKSQAAAAAQKEAAMQQSSSSNAQPGAADNSSAPAQNASNATADAAASASAITDSDATQAQATQLARTLDELDRLLAASSADGDPAAVPPPSSSSPVRDSLNSLTQAAAAQQAALAASRQSARQQTALARSQTASRFSAGSSLPPAGGDFESATISRAENADWGKLRSQAAEDVTQGQSEAVAAEYRESVETYFRVLAERARSK